MQRRLQRGHEARTELRRRSHREPVLALIVRESSREKSAGWSAHNHHAAPFVPVVVSAKGIETIPWLSDSLRTAARRDVRARRRRRAEEPTVLPAELRLAFVTHVV